MDNLRNRLKVELVRKNKIFYNSSKDNPQISRTAKFGGKMLENMVNIPLL